MRKISRETLYEEISDKLKNLSEEKLHAVYHFVSYLADHSLDYSDISAKELMVGSEGLLAREWDTPAENKAWIHL
jgi:hypothetical protein